MDSVGNRGVIMSTRGCNEDLADWPYAPVSDCPAAFSECLAWVTGILGWALHFCVAPTGVNRPWQAVRKPLSHPPSDGDLCPQFPGYTLHQNWDFWGTDLLQASSFMKALAECNLRADCVAFNSGGWVKGPTLPPGAASTGCAWVKNPAPPPSPPPSQPLPPSCSSYESQGPFGGASRGMALRIPDGVSRGAQPLTRLYASVGNIIDR